ncbi:hypothetical protein ABZS71_18840 [Streptomyces sp. NPDC005393]|uniref:hypothetical protein n=1 Tax=Streptomyces sp. NPDC005393 TaxID=3157041 RepID=UPI0033A8FB50
MRAHHAGLAPLAEKMNAAKAAPDTSKAKDKQVTPMRPDQPRPTLVHPTHRMRLRSLSPRRSLFPPAGRKESRSRRPKRAEVTGRPTQGSISSIADTIGAEPGRANARAAKGRSELKAEVEKVPAA